jgi:hypothetical protein
VQCYIMSCHTERCGVVSVTAIASMSRIIEGSLVTVWTGRDRTGQDRTGQDRTGQDRTGQDRTGQDRTGERRGQDGKKEGRKGEEGRLVAGSVHGSYCWLHRITMPI